MNSVNSTKPPNGIITVLNTPFRQDGSLDFEGLSRHVAYALDAGVSGFLVPAKASEVDSLANTEKLAIVERVLEATKGRAVVVGGTAAATRDEQRELVRELGYMGCPAVLISQPFESETAFRETVHETAENYDGFLMIQDWDPVGDGLPIDIIVRLFEEVEKFKALKVEVTPSGPKYTRVLEATAGALHVSGGWAVMQMIEGLDRGVHAFMPTGLHRTYTRIYNAHAAGDREEAKRLHERVLPILAFSNQRLDISIHFFKRLLHAQGIYATPQVRLPGTGFDAIQEQTAGELIERAIALESENV